MHPKPLTALHPLALAACLALAAPALAQTAPSEHEATDMQEVRVYGAVEKDTGFAPKETETAAKMPARLLETP